jgi:hypothetical protein
MQNEPQWKRLDEKYERLETRFRATPNVKFVPHYGHRLTGCRVSGSRMFSVIDLEKHLKTIICLSIEAA